MTGSNSPITFTVSGSNFVSGTKVQVGYASNGYTFVDTNTNASYVNANTLTVPITTQTQADTWRVRVKNPDGQTSSGYVNLVVVDTAVTTGTLNVTTTPVNGDIFVDNQWRGNGSISIPLAAGSYTVSFGMVGGYTTPASQPAPITVGQPTDITGTYTPTGPTTGSLQVTVQRSDTNAALKGATVTLSGPSPYISTTGPDGATTFSDLLPGTYTVTASLSGFQTNHTQVPVSADWKVVIPISLTPTQTGKIPLIFIPGIAGTELWRVTDGPFPVLAKVWLNPTNISLPIDLFTLGPLRQGEHGEDIADLQPTQVIESIGLKDVYGDFIRFLRDFESQGYRVVTLPYDWRLHLTGQTSELAVLIKQLRDETGRDRVDIVAHSMGGLLAKAYLNKRDAQGKKINEGTVRNLMMIATPHFGSVKALKALLSGEDDFAGWGEWLLDKDMMARIFTNMPTAYQLLPSNQYYNYKQVFTIKNDVYGGIYEELLPYSDLLAVLEDQNNIWPRRIDFMNYDEPLNKNIRAWVAPHNGTDGWDNWVPTDLNLKAYLFYGIGLETMGAIRYREKDFASGKLRYDYDSEWVEGKEGGDGTVPAFSARAGDLRGFDEKRYPFETETLSYTLPPAHANSTPAVQKTVHNSAEHLEILKHSRLRGQISAILRAGGTSSSSGIMAAPLETTSVQMSQAVATVQSGWIEVALDSEVATLHLFDALGNHVGPTAQGGSDTKIAVSQYLASGKVKVAIVPEGGTYTLKIQTTGAGQADLRITEYLEGDPVQILHYRGISLGPSGQAQMVINEVVPTLVLEVDGNGDGVTELQMTANNPPVANASLDQAVNEGAWVALDGTRSVNPYGGSLTYQWAQTAGPAVTLSGDTTATPSFSAPSVDADTTVAFSLIVNDGSANSNPDTVTVLVRNYMPLAVWTAGLPTGEKGVAYVYGLLADGGTPPYTWSVIKGQLPSGLTLDTAGTITGTPTKAKTKTFTVQVTDATGSPTTQDLSLQIVKGVTIKTKKLKGGTVWAPYSSLLKTNGGTLPLAFSVVGGALPPGLTLDPGTGQVTGIPTVAGAFDFVAQVTSSGGSSHQKNIRIRIK